MGWNPMLEQAYEKVREWLKAVYRPSQIERAIHVLPDTDEYGAMHIKIWTDTNEYRIRIVLKSGGLENAYMGASASTRKPRTGETWTRGNDLPDGKFSEELWRDILAAIVKYEAQEIKSEKWKEETPGPRTPG